MSIEKIIEKVDAIEAANQAKIVEAVEAVKIEIEEKFSALEAKVAEVKTPSIIQAPAKTVKQEVNRMVREQIRDFTKSTKGLEKEIKLWESTGNAGAAWGYAINNNGSGTTVNTNIWQLNLQDINVQFPIRTAALDDIDGLEANVVDDMLVEFSQVEGQSMIQNNDQSGTTTTSTGGTNGLRGLNYYPGANSTYTGGTTSAYAFGTSGTGATAGLNSIATYDQITTNGFASANNVQYADLINFLHALPQHNWFTMVSLASCLVTM